MGIEHRLFVGSPDIVGDIVEIARIDVSGPTGSNEHTYGLIRYYQEHGEHVTLRTPDLAGIKRDDYERPLVAVPLQAMIDALHRDTARRQNPYRRYMLALAMLREFQRPSWTDDPSMNITVVPYGH